MPQGKGVSKDLAWTIVCMHHTDCCQLERGQTAATFFFVSASPKIGLMHTPLTCDAL
ncbi:hypothetical protein PAXRUDRAFT_834273 [Paxillus rubicundulus Ve08.2h10]|uniref:Uncharacterized protein n=1 Tax=Paxillus rubicundulus Ve08.2h10 TaxID=930991 RepID=A0A0D0C806_9AGAM|nr:hypothetical protein PAXRUDRAFT_834273 [Paxillus rubicundulus Ve08.2h10]